MSHRARRAREARDAVRRKAERQMLDIADLRADHALLLSVANKVAKSWAATESATDPALDDACRELATTVARLRSRDRDRGPPRGVPLPHHRAYGSVPRRFGWLGAGPLGQAEEPQGIPVGVREGLVECRGPGQVPGAVCTAGRRSGGPEADTPGT